MDPDQESPDQKFYYVKIKQKVYEVHQEEIYPDADQNQIYNDPLEVDQAVYKADLTT